MKTRNFCIFFKLSHPKVNFISSKKETKLEIKLDFFQKLEQSIIILAEFFFGFSDLSIIAVFMFAK